MPAAAAPQAAPTSTPTYDSFETLFEEAEAQGVSTVFPTIIARELFRQHAARRASTSEAEAITEIFTAVSGWREACIATEVFIRDYLERRGEVEPVGSEPGSDDTYESDSSQSGDETPEPCQALSQTPHG